MRKRWESLRPARADSNPPQGFARVLTGPPQGPPGSLADTMTTKPFETPLDLVATVQAAQDGDEDAWARLVRRFERMLRRIGHSYRLAPGDVADVVEARWLRAFPTLHALREPAAIAAWLAMTARREALCR